MVTQIPRIDHSDLFTFLDRQTDPGYLTVYEKQNREIENNT